MIGQLDRRITFKIRALGAKDGYGDEAVTTSDLTVWAHVSFVSDGERMRADQALSTITHRFVVRYYDATKVIGADSQIVFDGRTYEIIGAPKEIERRSYIEFSATAQAAGV